MSNKKVCSSEPKICKCQEIAKESTVLAETAQEVIKKDHSSGFFDSSKDCSIRTAQFCILNMVSPLCCLSTRCTFPTFKHYEYFRYFPQRLGLPVALSQLDHEKREGRAERDSIGGLGCLSSSEDTVHLFMRSNRTTSVMIRFVPNSVKRGHKGRKLASNL